MAIFYWIFPIKSHILNNVLSYHFGHFFVLWVCLYMERFIRVVLARNLVKLKMNVTTIDRKKSVKLIHLISRVLWPRIFPLPTVYYLPIWNFPVKSKFLWVVFTLMSSRTKSKISSSSLDILDLLCWLNFEKKFK